jgi:aspartate/methionine/tyrosine aminotransferase
MFSQRTSWDLQPSALAEAWAVRRRISAAAFDLTVSNPTAAGFAVDLSAVAAALSDGASAGYDPIPFGQLSARKAVCDYYRQDHGLNLHARRVVLTVSTSEAYSFLFRLLCNPGDDVVFLQPSYPLFDFLAGLDDVVLRPAVLFYDEGWHVDRDAVLAAITARTKALLLVHPNNPTGQFIAPEDRAWFCNFCADRGLALIVDEVFLDYSLGGVPTSFLDQSSKALTFVLSGLSKISGLPQMKLAWIAVQGPEPLVKQALERLDVIADTFLSLSTPMQLALPALLEVRRQLQPQIMDRLRANLTALDHQLEQQQLVKRLQVEGGWYAILRIPALEDSEAAAIRLVSETGVHVHPGSFFGFGPEGMLVVSLLTPRETFERGISLLLKHIQNFE